MLDEASSGRHTPAMTHEHPPGRPPSHATTIGNDDAARALRAQLLATEHWSLLATRNLSWNESFARAGMFLTVLTGAVVALALVAQATGFSQDFVIFALLLLPVVLFVGTATFNRLNEINQEDVVWVQGMNRLRRAYLELDPGIEPFLISGWTEDVEGVLRTFGASSPQPSLRQNLSHALVTTPVMILVINCVVAAVLVGLVLAQLGASMEAAALGATIGFVVVFAGFAVYGGRRALAFWGSGRATKDG
jgi:ABC-type transport system involved in cytochrome bd biosynthesis fused ATPase/permease subunit